MMGNICANLIDATENMEKVEKTESISNSDFQNRSFESYTREQSCHLYDENGNFIREEVETKIPFQNTDKNINPVEQIMKKLEDEGTQLAINSLKDTTSTTSEISDKLVSFMSDGAKQFEKEAGRPMTYFEMRSMWG